MKPFLLWLLIASAAFAGDDKKELPALPPEIILSNGTKLQVLAISRWEKDRVIVKHPGGADPVFYANISADQRPVFEQWRDEATRQKEAAKKASFIAQPPVEAIALKERTIKGQVFVATKGGANYKLGGVPIYAMPLGYLDDFKKKTDPVPEAQIASGESDAEGLFTLKIPPAQPFFIFARASRRVYDGTEYYRWVVSEEGIPADRVLLLNNSNVIPEHTQIQVYRR